MAKGTRWGAAADTSRPLYSLSIRNESFFPTYLGGAGRWRQEPGLELCRTRAGVASLFAPSAKVLAGCPREGLVLATTVHTV